MLPTSDLYRECVRIVLRAHADALAYDLRGWWAARDESIDRRDRGLDLIDRRWGYDAVPALQAPTS